MLFLAYEAPKKNPPKKVDFCIGFVHMNVQNFRHIFISWSFMASIIQIWDENSRFLKIQDESVFKFRSVLDPVLKIIQFSV